MKTKPKKKKKAKLTIEPRPPQPPPIVVDLDGNTLAVGDYVAGIHLESKLGSAEGTIRLITREYGGVSVILKSGVWLSCVVEGDQWRAGGVIQREGQPDRKWGVRRVA